MTREELVTELKAMRAALDELRAQAAQLDLAAKRAALRDPDLAEVAALHAEDVRLSLEAPAKRASNYAAMLAGRGKGAG